MAHQFLLVEVTADGDAVDGAEVQEKLTSSRPAAAFLFRKTGRVQVGTTLGASASFGFYIPIKKGGAIIVAQLFSRFDGALRHHEHSLVRYLCFAVWAV